MIRTTPNGLAALFGRLTDPQDRETYAALISFVDSLPEHDELFRIVQLLGLLSLVGQRVPVALAELVAELRTQTKASAEYHSQVDARLAALPQEIAAGVDPAAVATAMSESFRQQLAATGLYDTASLLKAATVTIKTLSGELATTLKPLTSEYRGIALTLSGESAKLVGAARQVEEHNERLMYQQRWDHSTRQAIVALLLFLLGGLVGIVSEKWQTVDVLANMSAQIERLQTPMTRPTVETPANPGMHNRK